MPAYFPPLTIDGQFFDFAHLEPFTFTVTSLLAKKDLKVHVTFSNHCFTEGFEAEKHRPGQPVIMDGVRQRLFCPVRYRLSLNLPAVIQGLIHPKAKVWETAAERNWCYSITIEDPSGPYHVFFEVRRAGREKRQWQDINLVIESAYHEGEGGGPVLKGSMAFALLCGKVYMGHPTATKR
ncbi:hypothetical protein PVE_P0021 (plasmid) [Pseudomonas veronii 1YdBTEX2]|uniref:Uncharacterized protein n=1 Tax=Pseudomonas veronii 1YdBTEX2 TaxID=1295141 RepID=A0A1D3K9Q7_PSEVE|nr:hypothetical protein PVE_P0021 [Pseudomonas veronii 1YdBTEX2]